LCIWKLTIGYEIVDKYWCEKRINKPSSWTTVYKNCKWDIYKQCVCDAIKFKYVDVDDKYCEGTKDPKYIDCDWDYSFSWSIPDCECKVRL
jgi:hypothetical protein